MFIPLNPLQVVNAVCAAVSAVNLSAENWISIVSAIFSALMLLATIYFSLSDKKNAAEANKIASEANMRAAAANDKADTANEIAGKSLDTSMFFNMSSFSIQLVDAQFCMDPKTLYLISDALETSKINCTFTVENTSRYDAYSAFLSKSRDMYSIKELPTLSIDKFKKVKSNASENLICTFKHKEAIEPQEYGDGEKSYEPVLNLQSGKTWEYRAYLYWKNGALLCSCEIYFECTIGLTDNGTVNIRPNTNRCTVANYRCGLDKDR